jgi:polyisoprenoid-binding protein YceI
VNRTAVQIFEGITLSALATAIPAGTTWTADPVHSTVGFSVKHMVVSTFRGRFEDFDATLTAAGDGTLRLDGRVRAESIVVKDENLAAHLRSADFFDTARFPEITFASTLVRAEDGELVVEGELTVKGRTRPLRARGLELEATVDRREYGLDWNAPLPKGGFALDNDVRLQVNLELLAA